MDEFSRKGAKKDAKAQRISLAFFAPLRENQSWRRARTGSMRAAREAG